MKVYKTKWFMRYARQQDIDDSQLCKAIETAEKGLIDADLGGGVIKQRLPRANQGKSAGFRTIILFRSGDKAFFVYGYSKNDLDNIRKDELTAFKQLAIEMLNYDAGRIAISIKTGALTEVNCGENDL